MVTNWLVPSFTMLFWSTQTTPLLELSPLCPQWDISLQGTTQNSHFKNPTPTTHTHTSQLPQSNTCLATILMKKEYTEQITPPKWTIFKVPSVSGEAPAMKGSYKECLTWRRNTLSRSHHTKVNNLQSPFCIGRGTCHVRILQRMSYLKKEYTEQITPHQSEQSSKSLLYRARHLPCEDPSKNVLLEEGIHWTDQTTPKWTIFKVPSVLGEAPAMWGSCKKECFTW